MPHDLFPFCENLEYPKNTNLNVCDQVVRIDIIFNNALELFVFQCYGVTYQ